MAAPTEPPPVDCSSRPVAVALEHGPCLHLRLRWRRPRPERMRGVSSCSSKHNHDLQGKGRRHQWLQADDPHPFLRSSVLPSLWRKKDERKVKGRQKRRDLPLTRGSYRGERPSPGAPRPGGPAHPASHAPGPHRGHHRSSQRTARLAAGWGGHRPAGSPPRPTGTVLAGLARPGGGSGLAVGLVASWPGTGYRCGRRRRRLRQTFQAASNGGALRIIVN
jgi:hypothetical protein